MSLAAMEKKPISIGPWGGPTGSPWNDGVYSTVRQLVVAHGSGIDSIQIEYDQKGTSVWSEKHGGSSGGKTDKVKLDFPDEFLTSVYGHYGAFKQWGEVIVRSLTFETNRRRYGPYGVEKGTPFSFPIRGGKIIGFHGRSGFYLDSIGVHLKPLQNKLAPKSAQQNAVANNVTEKLGYSVIQGSVGENYDIVLAVRQKDSFGNPIPSVPPKKACDIKELSDSETKEKKVNTQKAAPKKVEGPLRCGPWGGNGGITFDDGVYTGIRQINVSRNIGIVSIKVCYDHNGQAVWGSKHGGTGGFKTDKVIFDYPYEILTHITGTYTPLMYMGPYVIKSLTFHTTKGKHGPYGEEQGPSFTSKIEEGKIVGFHGREGLFLDAIGVLVMQGKVQAPTHPVSNAIISSKGPISEIDNPQWSNKLLLARGGSSEQVACGVVKEPAPCGPGPWGGDGGRAWDDGVFSGIKQIFITRRDSAICSIQIEYDRNGQSVWSVKHGGNIGTFTHRVKLEIPNEVLSRISGYYGAIGNDERSKVVKSLTFYTSRGRYGPFGEEVGTYFTSTTTEGKVVGFHGRSSSYLDAIGVHMQHWFGNYQRNAKPSRFHMFRS